MRGMKALVYQCAMVGYLLPSADAMHSRPPDSGLWDGGLNGGAEEGGFADCGNSTFGWWQPIQYGGCAGWRHMVISTG
jgi:hypothetical protein